MLRISAYGQTGPKRDELDLPHRTCVRGVVVVGRRSRGPPVVPGSTSMADYVSGMGARSGSSRCCAPATKPDAVGSSISVCMNRYSGSSTDRAAYAKYGTVRERMGADTINVVPHSHYRTGTGEWVALACTNDKMFERLATLMDQPELVQAFPTSAIRVQNRERINAVVTIWMATYPLDEVIERTRVAGVPCAQIYSIREIFEDPLYRARENLLHVDDPRVGMLVLPAPVPRLSETPPAFRHAGRALGADNERLWRTTGSHAEDVAVTNPA